MTQDFCLALNVQLLRFHDISTRQINPKSRDIHHLGGISTELSTFFRKDSEEMTQLRIKNVLFNSALLIGKLTQI